MILRYIVYSNLFVSVCVMVLSYGTMHVFNHGQSNKWWILTGLGTFVIYNLQRFMGHWIAPSDNRKMMLSGNRGRVTITLFILSVIGSLLFVRDLNWKEYIILIPASVISIFYVSDLFFKRANTGLRSVPFLKIFLIAFVWALVTVALPVSDQFMNWDRNILILFAERFFFILAITIPFDIRDMGIDNLGLRTIPQILGIRKSKMLSGVLLLIAATCSLFLLEHVYSLNKLMIIIAFYVFVLLLIVNVSRDKSDLYYSFWIEGTMLIWGVLLTFL